MQVFHNFSLLWLKYSFASLRKFFLSTFPQLLQLKHCVIVCIEAIASYKCFISKCLCVCYLQWVPPPETLQAQKDADEQIAIDMGDEYEMALTNASQEEIIDLAGKKV